MKTKRIGFIVLAVLLVMSMTLAGCGSQPGNTVPDNSSNSQSPSPSPSESSVEYPADPVSISIWTGYPELDSWFNKMAEEYKAEHSNVSIEILSFPLRDFEKKVATALPSNSCSDIISINPSIALRYIQANLILKAPEDLSEFVNSGAYAPAVANDAMYEGIVYGIPHMLSNAGLFYNTKMFKEAGLTEPPKSMDELVEYARKLAKTDANGKLIRSGLSLRLSGGGSGVAEKFWTLLMQHGGTLVEEVSPGKYRAGYDNDAGLKTLQMYVDMLHKYYTDDPALPHDTEGFESESSAMFIRETWVISDIAQKAPDLEYDTAPLFRANMAVEKDFYVTNTAKGDKSIAAWDFVRFLMKPENHKQMTEMSGWHPARNDLDMEDFFEKVPQYRAFFEDYEEVLVYPMIPEYDEIQTKFADRLANFGFTDTAMVDNPEKMKAFLAEAAQETNEILKENGHLAE